MAKTIPADPRFTAQQHQILNRWRDVLDDMRDLCAGLKALPDHCSCGDAQGHLKGSCACCQTAREGHLPPCTDCDTLLATLTPAVDHLTVDTWQFFPSVLDFLDLRERQAGRVAMGARERHIATVARQDAADAVERRIAAVVETFKRLVVAADEFRTGCRASHLQTLKTVANEVLTEVERLERAW